MQVMAYLHGGGMNIGGMNVGGAPMDGLVWMRVVLNREASAQRNEGFQEWIRQNRREIQTGQLVVSDGKLKGPFGDEDLRNSIERAMKEGEAEGVLAPERLLAEDQLASRVGRATPVPATPEAAAQAAEAAHAKWTTIYTLRKSPVDNVGIKLVHAGQKMASSQTLTNRFSQDMLFQFMEQRSYNLSPVERAAHERAVQALKQKQ
jgi:hypothetical protein